jgi:drug/metabolite transporter (DMT)-like permease
LVLWTANGIGLGLLNKAAFSIVSFPYPYALTAIHMVVNSAACQYIFYSVGQDTDPKKNIWVKLLGDGLIEAQKSKLGEGTSAIWAFSVLFSLNIAIGNVSLTHVSINFNQVMRSLDPLLMLGFNYVLKKHVSVKKRIAVWPVVIGVAMACVGDRMSVTTVGFIYTVLCVVLGAVKIVASSELMTGKLKLHPVRLLQLMAPSAFLQCVVLSVITGEAGDISQRWSTDLDPVSTGDWKPVSVLLLSGVFAFSLNISALQAYKLTSPLTICIVAAVKQVLMIFVGTAMFRTPITPLNGGGIFVVLVASTYYSYVTVVEQTLAEQQAIKDNAVADAVAVASTDEEEGGAEPENMPLMDSSTETLKRSHDSSSS